MFNTSELDELFRILISIKGIKLRQPQWSNTTVRVETDHLEDLYNEIEDKDLNIVNVSFRITAIREAHLNKIVHNMVVHVNCIFKGTK